MKISLRSSVLILTAAALLSISACGGSDSSSEAAPRTKNAALCIPQKTKDRTSTCIPMNSTTVVPIVTAAPDTTVAPFTTAPLANTVDNLSANAADGCTTAQANAQKASGFNKQLLKPNGVAVATTTTIAKIDCVPATTIAPATTVVPTIMAAPGTTVAPPGTTVAPLTTPVTTAKPTICSKLDFKLRKC